MTETTRTLGFYWRYDRAGGIIIELLQSPNPKPIKSCYLQPGDEANQFVDTMDEAIHEEARQSIMSQYSEVMN